MKNEITNTRSNGKSTSNIINEVTGDVTINQQNDPNYLQQEIRHLKEILSLKDEVMKDRDGAYTNLMSLTEKINSLQKDADQSNHKVLELYERKITDLKKVIHHLEMEVELGTKREDLLQKEIKFLTNRK